MPVGEDEQLGIEEPHTVLDARDKGIDGFAIQGFEPALSIGDPETRKGEPDEGDVTP